MNRTTITLFSIAAAFLCMSTIVGCGERKRKVTNINLEDLKDLPEFKNIRIDTFTVVGHDKEGWPIYDHKEENQSTYAEGRFGGTLYVLSEDSLAPGLHHKISVYNPGYASEYHQVLIKNDSVIQGGFFEGFVDVLDKRKKYDVLVEGAGFEKSVPDSNRTIFRKKCTFKGTYKFEGTVRIGGEEREFLYYYVVI